ncbi:MAG: hypothetical protein HY303_06110 [Candidatus Wallbacteria bacterium]|nr:hypothetical protein [Candidatus Wallbacteria bacterium]
MSRRAFALLLAALVAAPAAAKVPLHVDDLTMRKVGLHPYGFDLTSVKPRDADVDMKSKKPDELPALDGRGLPTREPHLFMKFLKPGLPDLFMAGFSVVPVGFSVGDLKLVAEDLNTKALKVVPFGYDTTALKPVSEDLAMKGLRLVLFGFDLKALKLVPPDLTMQSVPLRPFDFEL